MAKTIVGVFATRAAAEDAMTELRSEGYDDDEIGMVAKNASGQTVKANAAGDSKAAEGAAIGAATGAVATAAVGAGIMMGVIPVIGPILALGPLAVTLINAAGGAAVAGIAGALVGMGLPEEDAKYYEGEVNAGRFVVTVNTDDAGADIHSIYKQHGGYDRTSQLPRNSA